LTASKSKVKGQEAKVRAKVYVGFEILGVVDLRHGVAVRARGGRRDKYVPIGSVAGESIPRGHATALARQYVSRFGVSALYVADLDAIEQRKPQHALVRAIASVGVPVWLDAGLTSSEDARHALESGASRLIVGLETLPSFQELRSIVNDVGHQRVVFSLDLCDGQPIAAASELTAEAPENLVARAIDAGVAAVIVLDLARVGAGCGFDLPLISRLRTLTPSVPLYAGGGARSMDDVVQARSAGCQGVLVASALLDGHITSPLPFALCPLP
jgi:phosphoribosylformimino-5-aminoimidazole carboxamide ribotide isomerase